MQTAKWTKLSIGYKDVHGAADQKIQAKVLVQAVQYTPTCAIQFKLAGHVFQVGSWIGKQYATWVSKALPRKHTIKLEALHQVLSVKRVFLADQEVLVCMDTQVKLVLAVAVACLNAT